MEVWQHLDVWNHAFKRIAALGSRVTHSSRLIENLSWQLVAGRDPGSRNHEPAYLLDSLAE